MGWSSPPPEAKDLQNNDSITSPLRITKRDSPRSSSSQLARRSSSSYRHVRNNNLVTKSPFKSHIPTPSTPSRPSSVAFPLTRRVSGEKRPRPQSIHEQMETENERPFALKRERRQSKGFQNLLEKEPVSKSPFRLHQSGTPRQTPPPIPSSSESRLPTLSTSRLSVSAGALGTQASSPDTGPSPTRSSLVSRRLHGPRLSGSGRRERRKTVTFDERCDVVEFAPDEEEEDEEAFASADDEMYGGGSDQQDDDDDFFHGTPNHPPHPPNVPDEDASFDSIHLSDVEAETSNPSLRLDPDASITGLVDEMFASNSATSETSIPLRYSTPPRVTHIPPDLETEGGVPLGRSHHAERSLQHHQQQYQSPHPAPPVFSPNKSPEQSHRSSPSVSDSPSGYPFNIGISPRASPLSQPITPPRRSHANMPPLGRSTHAERIRKAREEEIASDIGMDNDLGKLPVSPSPMKKTLTLGAKETSDVDILVPPLGVVDDTHITQSVTSQPFSGTDPFAHGKASYVMHEDEDSFNLSIGNSEISLTGLGRDPESLETNVERELKRTPLDEGSVLKEEPLRNLSPLPGIGEGSRLSPFAREHSDSPVPRMSSPLFRATSPLLTSRNRSGSNASLTSRQRITREDVQRRLLKRRSFGSPAPEVEPESKPAEDKMIVKERDEAGRAEPGLVDVEMSHEDETKENITSFSRSIDDECFAQLLPAASPMNDRNTSPTAAVVKAASEELESFGILTRTSENDVKMGDESSGSSSNSSTTAVETVNVPNIKMEFNDVDMDMKSALDRLMDDVADVGSREGEDSMITECDSFEPNASSAPKSNRAPLGRAMTEPTPLLHTSTGIGFSPDKDRSDSSIEPTPPPLPPKDNIRTREQMILEKRREMRQLEAEVNGESEHSGEYFCPPRRGTQTKKRHVQQRLLGVGRPTRRRSMSTGDADHLRKGDGEGLLDGVVGDAEGNDALADSIEKEFRKLVEPQRKAKYQVREREGTIYASSSDPDGVSHMAGPGEVNAGRAWRTVRRPSDMNEYAKQIREYRAQAEPGKAYGKVFVKILGIKNMHLPLPQHPTSLTCTLNNGIHFVTTPESQLGQNTRIDQEFELIEQNKLEFTLTLKVKRDPHIMAQFKALSPAPPPPPAPIIQAPSKGGMRSFFYSTPKKPTKVQPSVAPPPPVQRMPENLARYMKPDGILARVFVAFKDIAARCDTRLFETSYPLIGQRLEVGGKFSAQQVGELVLQIFRLPPLPGIAPEQLPQSLDECCRGLRHINWHKVTYFEGTLTQYGGDCTTWRRRRFRVIGAALVAFNDITKKATATIDLKKATAVEDDQQGRGVAMGPSSSRTTRYGDDYDMGVERSFRLIFPKDEEIIFFADSDEEKAKWLEIFRALIGHIPPHPLWGELLWQRQEELTKRAQVQVLSEALSHPSPHEAQRTQQ
ncbi:hypothetical protein AX15_006520 [Amanita polypyramis BW_CC]|nr:hypothetical protein AX15_006520 [Amanita polypyramis BW_CC]